MKKLITILSLLATTAWGANVKLSDLPLGDASTVGTLDSFPYVNSSLNETMRLELDDLINVPALSAALAGKASTGSATFTGTVTVNGHETIVGTADAVQLSVKGFGTQTNDIFHVLKSDATSLFKVTNAGDGTFAGSVTATSFIGPATGNLTLATPHNHGVLLSGSALATTAITPSSSTVFPLVSGGASADPAWSLLTVPGGGSGAATFTSNGMLYGSGTSAFGVTSAGSQYQVFQSGASGVPTVGALQLAQSAAVTGVLPNANTTAASSNTASAIVARDGSGNFSAGTITASVTGTSSGNTTYTANNHGVVVSGSTNAMTVVAPNASTALPFISGGASADPSWAVLGISGGGTGQVTANAGFNALSPLTTLGDTLYGAASGAGTRLAGNATTTEKVLSQTGDGANSAAPVWLADATANTVSTLVKRDSSGNFAAGTITATVTGTASGNTTYTANNHGVVVSGSANTMTVVAPNASTAFPLVSGGASADPAWAALTVAGGGTGITSGTSGGVPYFSSTSAIASSGALTASQLVLGGGAGASPTSLAAGSQYQVLRMGASNPAYGQVNLDQSAAVTGVLPNANTTAASATGASTIVARDSNGSFLANNVGEAYTTTATAASTTTLTAAATRQQYWTGSSTQTVKLPDATTLPALGFSYRFVNLSSGNVTVQDNSAGAVQVMGANSFAIFTAKSISTAAGSWDSQYASAAAGTVTSVALSVPSGLAVSGSPITTSGTLAITASGQFAASQMPAFTGDITTSAGAVATTAAATQANITTLSNSAGVAVHGINTNTAASAGNIGEVIESTQSPSTGMTATTTQYQNVGSCLTLTAGAWLVDGILSLNANGATVTSFVGGIGTVTGNDSTGITLGQTALGIAPPTAAYNAGVSIPPMGVRVANGNTATQCLKVQAVFTAATPNVGGRITAYRFY